MSAFTFFRTHCAPFVTIRTYIKPTSRPSYRTRAIHSTSSQPEKINNLTQGHVKNLKNVHPQDVQSQSAEGGLKARKDEANESIDAANEYEQGGRDKRPDDMGKGNPERIGFVEQVGGASASARKFEKEGKNN